MPGCRIVSGDLDDAAAVEAAFAAQPHIVIHLASVPGGMAEQLAVTRPAPLMLFRFAPRLHEGAFLSPDEVPAILQRGERVLNREEARRYNRSERGGQPNIYVTIQTPSPASFQASRTQLAADLSRAVQIGMRGR